MITYTHNGIRNWRELSFAEQNRNVLVVSEPTDDQMEKLKKLLVKLDILAAFYSAGGLLGVRYDLENKIEPEDFFISLEDIFYD